MRETYKETLGKVIRRRHAACDQNSSPDLLAKYVRKQDIKVNLLLFSECYFYQ